MFSWHFILNAEKPVIYFLYYYNIIPNINVPMRKYLLLTSALIIPLILSAQYVARYELSSSALISNFQFYTIHFDENGQKEELDLSIMKATTYIFYHPQQEKDSVFVLLNTVLNNGDDNDAGYFRSSVSDFFNCKKSNFRTIHDTLGYDMMLIKEQNGTETSLSIKFHDSQHKVRSLLCIPTQKMPLIEYAIMKTDRGSIRLYLVDLSETTEKVTMPELSKIGKEISYDTWCDIKKYKGGFGGF